MIDPMHQYEKMVTKMLLIFRGAPQRVPWAWLLIFVAAGFLVRIVSAVKFPTIERPDEIFQNLEPAHRLLTGFGFMTWEWRDGVRSWLFPGFLSAIMRLSELLSLPDSAILPLIWSFLALVSCGTIAVGVTVGWRLFGQVGAVLCGLLTAFWPDLVYFGPKTLGEVQAGNLLVIAAALVPVGREKPGVGRLFVIGAVLGAAFDLRFQLALTILLIASWAARTEVRWAWLPLLFGAIGPLIALGLTDWLTLGSPYQSVWKNIQVNLLQHKADTYSVDPAYMYIQNIVARNGSAVIPMALFFLYGFHSAPLLSLAAISIIGFHSMISHKEISFIYAALPFSLIIVGLGASRFLENLQIWLKRPPTRWVALLVASVLFLLTAGAIFISQRPFTPSANQVAMRRLFEYARMQKDMCGLGLVGEGSFPWFDTGGYTMLQRNIPVYLATSTSAFLESRNGFNYAIAQRLLLDEMPGFKREFCTLGYCLFQQARRCDATSVHLISNELSLIDH